jgi:anti-sigma B factor antagonist
VEFTIERRGDTLVIGVPETLIVQNRQALKQRVVHELDHGQLKFLIDLSQTGYVDSAGLGALVSLSKKVREYGGELRLGNPNADLRRLLELTRVRALLQVDDGSDEGDGSAGRTAPLPPRPNGPLQDSGEADLADGP